MQLTEITFKKLYQQIIFKLKTFYSRADSSFTLASPFGQILSTVTELFQLNMLHTQSVQQSFDLNNPLNNNEKTIRALSKVGQYNPTRSKTAEGSIKVKLKAGVNIEEDIKGGKITFTDRQRLKNKKNNLEYVLNLNDSELTYTLSASNPIILQIVQGSWKNIIFTGTGERNQSYVVPGPAGKDIDNYKFKIFVNSEQISVKKHKFDMLPNEKACVVYTGFTGGIDVLFGNGDEGFVPPLGSIITVEYLTTDGQNGNLVDPQLNEFIFIDLPKSFYGEDIDTNQFFDIDVNTKINFGTNGDTASYLKSIMPFVSSNFVLVGPDQYKFFLQRLQFFSIIDVYTSKKSNPNLTTELYKLAKQNTDMLNRINNTDNNSTLQQLVKKNLDEIIIMRKLLLTEGGDNLINIFLIPDIRKYYGKDTDTNYFNIDTSKFVLDDDGKSRILAYLSNEGLQVITNEVHIIDPVIRKYVVNVTTRIYDDAVETNVINEITDKIADYFITQMRRDRIPPSDLVRILDGISDIDSVSVDFVSEQNEDYHKEFIIKADAFQRINSRRPEDTEIIMSDGTTYDRQKTLGLDNILGDILIDKQELPIIRGGFKDRYNNEYSLQPATGKFSAVNVVILPEKTKRKIL